MLDYDAPREEVDPRHRPPPVPNNNGLPVFPPLIPTEISQYRQDLIILFIVYTLCLL